MGAVRGISLTGVISLLLLLLLLILLLLVLLPLLLVLLILLVLPLTLLLVLLLLLPMLLIIVGPMVSGAVVSGTAIVSGAMAGPPRPCFGMISFRPISL